MKKTLLTIASMTGLILSPFASANAQETVATVNGVEITNEMIEQAAINKYSFTELSDQLLLPILESKVEDIEILKEQATIYVQDSVAQFESEEQAEMYFQMNQLGTIEDYTRTFYGTLLLDHVLAQSVNTSDEALQTYYDESYQPVVEMAQIVLETEEEANQAIERLIDGEDFGTLAQEISIDQLSASQNGYMGRFSQDMLSPELKTMIGEAENNSLVPNYMQSEQGYHIIFVINNGTPLTLEDNKEEIKNMLIAEQTTDPVFQQETIQQLLNDADIKFANPEMEAVFGNIATEGLEND